MEGKPFSGLKVIELASVLAGPGVGMFFAEQGAHVIKFENALSGGDVTRKWKLPSEDTPAGYSAYFASVNWGKEHRFLDMTSESDRQLFYDEIKTADILITNFKHGDDKKLGVESSTLTKINPRLIQGKITGFRSTPERVAFDIVLQAECGYLSMTGTPDGQTAKLPVAFIDLLAAHQLKEGILVALLQRHATGKGAVVEASLEEAALANLTNQATNVLMGKIVPGPMGTLHPNIAPYGEVLICKDNKSIILAVGNDKQFASLCTLLNLPELISDQRFLTNKARVADRIALTELMNDASASMDREVLLQKFIGNDVPAGAIRTMDEVMNSDMAKSMQLKETIDGFPTTRLATSVFHLTES